MTMCMKWCPNVHSGTLNSFWILSLMLLAVFIWAITLNVRELITCAKGHRENRSVFVLCWICWNEWSHSKSYFVWPLRYANLWPHHKGTTYHCSPHRRPAVAACTVSLSTCCLMHCTWVIALYFLITGLHYDFSIIYTWVLYPLREMDMGHMTSQIEVIPLSLAANNWCYVVEQTIQAKHKMYAIKYKQHIVLTKMSMSRCFICPMKT